LKQTHHYALYGPFRFSSFVSISISGEPMVRVGKDNKTVKVKLDNIKRYRI